MADASVQVVEFTPSDRPAEPSTAAPAAVPTTEEKKPEATAAESERSRWFAKMARQEQARVKREQDLKAREKAAEAKEKAIQEREAKLAGAKGAPLEALKAAGLTYDDVTNAQLNDGKPSAELIAQQAREEIAALRAELAKKDEAQTAEATTAAQQAKEAARKEFYGEAAEFCQKAGEAYELLNTFKPYHLIGQKIEETAEKTGKVLTYAETAQAVENALRGEIDKAANTKWFQSKYQPRQTAGQPPPAKPRATISNDLTAATPGSAPRRPERLDPIQAAIARYDESRRSSTH